MNKQLDELGWRTANQYRSDLLNLSIEQSPYLPISYGLSLFFQVFSHLLTVLMIEFRGQTTSTEGFVDLPMNVASSISGDPLVKG